MAVILPLTLQTLQDQIHTNFSNATDTPTAGSDDWNIRLALINNAIAYWAAQKAVEWNELWLVGNPTPSVVTLSTTQYNMPADFNRMGGYVRLVLASGAKKAIPVKQAEEAQDYINLSYLGAYVTGKPGSYKLNLLWTPTSTDPYLGATIEFDYYKYPLQLSGTSDVPEMSLPHFIVHSVVAKLFQTSSPTNYNIHNNMAIDIMQQMMEGNQLTARNNNSPGYSVVIGA